MVAVANEVGAHRYRESYGRYFEEFTAGEPETAAGPEAATGSQAGEHQAGEHQGALRVTDAHLKAALDQLLDTRSQLTRILLGGHQHATAPE